MKIAFKLMSVAALVVASSSMLMSCNFGCKKAYRYQAALKVIETKLADSAANPATIIETCGYMTEEGFRVLDKASRFADRAAYNKFFWSETKCVQGFWRQRCEYRGGGYYNPYPRPYPNPYPNPYPPHYGNPNYYCYDYYECTQYQYIEHKLDGYEDAMYVSAELKNAATQLNTACAKAKEGQSSTAAAMFMATKSLMSGPIRDKATLTLGKAGCYGPDTVNSSQVGDTNEESAE